jgi:FkbM family methyltransferase
MRDKAGVRFTIEQDMLFAEIDGLRLRMFRSDDVETLREVFLEQLYRFDLPGEHLTLDIGSNIGLASLYFARYHGGPVYAFELVPSTAEQTRTNFALNPEWSRNIKFFDYGLADSDQEFEIKTDPDHSAGNSIYRSRGSHVQKVRVRNAADVVKEALAEKEGRRVVVKLDAEGAEYAICRLWDKAGLLKEMDVLMMEWHRQDGESVDEIRDILRANGLRWFERQNWDSPHGMIYAIR